MAGTTRFGYSGGGSGRDDEPAGAPPADPNRATVFGRDTHQRDVAEPAPSPPAPGTAPAVSQAPAPPLRKTARLPSHSGKSGFPARAGFWGRRNTEGELEPPEDALDTVPSTFGDPRTKRLLRYGLVVVLCALVSFVAVLLAMKLAGPPSESRSPAPAPAAAPAPAPVPAAAPAVRPAPLDSEPGELAAPARTAADHVSGAGVRRRAPAPGKAPRRPRLPRGQGDQILPPDFK